MMDQSTVIQPRAASFEEAVESLRHASTALVNGDRTYWKAMCSHRQDVSLAGRAGGYNQGWATGVEKRYDWLADQYESGKLTYETVSSYTVGDLGYTHEVVRGTIVLKGKHASEPIDLRATHIFRCEEGRWKLLHRHADQAVVRRPLTQLSQAHGHSAVPGGSA